MYDIVMAVGFGLILGSGWTWFLLRERAMPFDRVERVYIENMTRLGRFHDELMREIRVRDKAWMAMLTDDQIKPMEAERVLDALNRPVGSNGWKLDGHAMVDGGEV